MSWIPAKTRIHHDWLHDELTFNTRDNSAYLKLSTSILPKALHVSHWQHLVLVFWPHSVWTKSLMCKDVVNRDSTFQSIFRRLCTAKKIEDFRFPVSRPDDVSSRPDPPLYREASVPACIRPDLSTSRSDVHQWSISFRFFPSSEYGKIDTSSRRCGFLSGRAHK
jgi:hypothetical protein